MNKYFLIFLLSSLFMPDIHGQATLQVIPEPSKIRISSGEPFILHHIKIQTDNRELDGVANFITEQLTGKFNLTVTGNRKATRLHLILNSKIEHSEGYKLSVNIDTIRIEATSPAGIFYGFQTLSQMLYNTASEKGLYHLIPSQITDEPRFGWRGFMLDESRHFFGKEKVKQILDLMALHKLNTFHWHLTDEPGWRIEIKKYPELTRTGAIGNYTDANAPAAFYKQKDIAEIIRYAAERFIRVIPEIDMPGHASAAVRAYPYLSGGGSEDHPDFTFNPGKEETYRFLSDVLREVAGLFPAPHIHVGGDEVHFGNQEWQTDPFIQKLMYENKLNDTKAVEHYFINRMNDTIRGLGKIMTGWDEIVQSEVAPQNSLVMWWRHDKPEVMEQALEKNYQVVLCPRIPLYFDFVQHETHQPGRRWAGKFSDIEGVYRFPESLGTVGGHPNIIGIQANLWTEHIATPDRLDFMMWPRLSALAESAWSATTTKDFEWFNEKLTKMFHIYDIYRLNYFKIF